jgi:prolyl oligopeptidase
MYASSRLLTTVFVLFAAVGLVDADSPAQATSKAKFTYPPAARANTGDWYHNTWVADPYRWLEQHGASTTTTWLDAQARLTRGYLDKTPRRKQILATARESLDYTRRNSLVCVSGKFYFCKNSGLEEQDSIYRSDTLDGDGELLLDPSKLWPDGTRTLKSFSVSGDGKYLAYSVSVNGADVTEWKILDLGTGKALAETLNADFSTPQWSTKLAGFYYDKTSNIYFHTVNTDPANDQFIYSDNGWYCHGEVTSSGNYLIITQSQGTSSKCRVLVRELATDAKTVSWLFPTANAVYDYICESDGVLYFRTSLDAPKGYIIKMDLKDRAHYSEVVAQSEDTLANVYCVRDKLFVAYLRNGHSIVKVFGLDGQSLAQIELPGEGTAMAFRADATEKGVLFAYSDYVTPPELLRYDLAGESKNWTGTVVYRPKLSFDLSQFKQEVVVYKSKDGTLVPMTLAYRKDLVKDGNNPVFLYGYGGFGINLTPFYRNSYATWLRLGGVLAVPNLRGGAEKGEAWHEAGTKLNKQNVFDDCRAAAHWLIDQKYTSAGKIALSGASNGGLLVGAVLTQEPELFGAALPHVGVLDMIRFPLFSVGSGWKPDYGDPANQDEFKALLSYSPYHNVRQGTRYPAVLVSTCDHDDRVEQAHSWKFAAALQYAQAAERPVMLLVGKDAGHLYGWTTSKTLAWDADRFAFVLDNLR